MRRDEARTVAAARPSIRSWAVRSLPARRRVHGYFRRRLVRALRPVRTLVSLVLVSLDERADVQLRVSSLLRFLPGREQRAVHRGARVDEPALGEPVGGSGGEQEQFLDSRLARASRGNSASDPRALRFCAGANRERRDFRHPLVRLARPVGSRGVQSQRSARYDFPSRSATEKFPADTSSMSASSDTATVVPSAARGSVSS